MVQVKFSRPDFRRDHPHAVFFQTQHSGDERTHQVRNLRRGVQVELAIRAAPLRHHTTRFHGHGHEPLADDALLHDHAGFGKRLIHIAAILVIGERDVIGPLGMHRGRTLRERLLGIGHCGQNLIIHFDEIRSIAREVAVAGHHHRDGMADKVDAVGG